MNASKVSVFIVRAENSGAPESMIGGVYPTVDLARARMAELESDEYGFDVVFFDEVKVGPSGADCEFYNR